LLRVLVLHGIPGKEKVSRIYEDEVQSFAPQLFDEGRPPGQTAKLTALSPAGLNLAVNVGGKEQRNGPAGCKRGTFSPKKEGEEKDKQDYQQAFLHDHPSQIFFPKPLPLKGRKSSGKSILGQSNQLGR
jgi:hypothetical protein